MLFFILFATILALLAPDDIGPIESNVRPHNPIAIRQPYISIKGGCKPYSLVDAEGNLNPGLSPSEDFDDCQAGHAQTYSTSVSGSRHFGQFYCYYFPKVQRYMSPTQFRHGMHCVALWYDAFPPNTIKFLSWTSDAHWHVQTMDESSISQFLDADGAPYFSIDENGVVLNPASTGGERWELLSWEHVDPLIRKKTEARSLGVEPEQTCLFFSKQAHMEVYGSMNDGTAFFRYPDRPGSSAPEDVGIQPIPEDLPTEYRALLHPPRLALEVGECEPYAVIDVDGNFNDFSSSSGITNGLSDGSSSHSRNCMRKDLGQLYSRRANLENDSTLTMYCWYFLRNPTTNLENLFSCVVAWADRDSSLLRLSYTRDSTWWTIDPGTFDYLGWAPNPCVLKSDGGVVPTGDELCRSVKGLPIVDWDYIRSDLADTLNNHHFGSSPDQWCLFCDAHFQREVVNSQTPGVRVGTGSPAVSIVSAANSGVSPENPGISLKTRGISPVTPGSSHTRSGNTAIEPEMIKPLPQNMAIEEQKENTVPLLNIEFDECQAFAVIDEHSHFNGQNGLWPDCKIKDLGQLYRRVITFTEPYLMYVNMYCWYFSENVAEHSKNWFLCITTWHNNDKLFRVSYISDSTWWTIDETNIETWKWSNSPCFLKGGEGLLPQLGSTCTSTKQLPIVQWDNLDPVLRRALNNHDFGAATSQECLFCDAHFDFEINNSQVDGTKVGTKVEPQS